VDNEQTALLAKVAADTDWIRKCLGGLRRDVEALEGRVRLVEIEQAKVKIKIGLWGGLAGIASLLVTLLRWVLYTNS
jgi:hypothetical protein